MARLLVLAHGPRKGEISIAKRDGVPFGSMEDKAEHLRRYGNLDRWPDTFVIVSLLEMSIEEAEELASPVVTWKDGPIDPLDGLPKQIPTMHYNSKGLIDFEAMADTGKRMDDLTEDRKISRSVGEVREHITERTSG